MSSRRALTLVPAVAIALTVLAACGGGSSTAGTIPADADVAVAAKEGITWSPTSFTVKATDGKINIYAENDASIAHNMYLLDKDGNVVGQHIDLPKKGSSGELVFDVTPGEYRIVCKVPGHDNMKAKVIVEA